MPYMNHRLMLKLDTGFFLVVLDATLGTCRDTEKMEALDQAAGKIYRMSL